MKIIYLHIKVKVCVGLFLGDSVSWRQICFKIKQLQQGKYIKKKKYKINN